MTMTRDKISEQLAAFESWYGQKRPEDDPMNASAWDDSWEAWKAATALAEHALEPQGQALLVAQVTGMSMPDTIDWLADPEKLPVGTKLYAFQLALPAGPVHEGDALDAQRYRKAVAHGVIVLHNGAKACVGKDEADAALDAIAPSPAVAQPVPDYLHAFTAEAAQRDPRLQEYTLKSVAQPVADEREAFEKWVRDTTKLPEHVAKHMSVPAFSTAWMAWQARAALCQPAAGEPHA